MHYAVCYAGIIPSTNPYTAPCLIRTLARALSVHYAVYYPSITRTLSRALYVHYSVHYPYTNPRASVHYPHTIRDLKTYVWPI